MNYLLNATAAREWQKNNKKYIKILQKKVSEKENKTSC